MKTNEKSCKIIVPEEPFGVCASALSKKFKDYYHLRRLTQNTIKS
jgi:hypothetical protein